MEYTIKNTSVVISEETYNKLSKKEKKAFIPLVRSSVGQQMTDIENGKVIYR